MKVTVEFKLADLAEELRDMGHPRFIEDLSEKLSGEPDIPTEELTEVFDAGEAEKRDAMETRSEAAPPPPTVEDPREAAPPPPTVEDPREAAPPPPPADVTVDAIGLPWDGRIHSDSKKFIANGTYRKKRGLSDVVLAEVCKEYGVDPDAKPSAGAPPPPPTDGDGAPPPPPPTDGAEGIAMQMPAFMKLLKSHGLELPAMNELARQVGVEEGIYAVAARLDKVPEIIALLPEGGPA